MARIGQRRFPLILGLVGMLLTAFALGFFGTLQLLDVSSRLSVAVALSGGGAAVEKLDRQQWLPSAECVWTVGSRAILPLLVSGGRGRALVVEADVQAFVTPARPRQTVRVFIGRAMLASWSFEQPQAFNVRTVHVPGASVQSDSLELTFEPIDPVSPADVGWGSETKKLTICLKALRVRNAS